MASPSGESAYDDSNRAFLQAFLSLGSLTLTTARPILASLLQRPADTITATDLQTYLNAANDALTAYDYEIRSTIHQVSKEQVHALVNSVSDPLTQLATVRSQDEIAYIRRLLDAMFETYNTERAEIMAVTSMQALKVTRVNRASMAADEEPTQGGAAIPNSQAERLLASLIVEGWFERSREGFYSLTPRALLELREWLISAYNEEGLEEGEWQRIKNCVACRGLVTVGQRCGDRGCTIRLHDICQGAYWRTQREKQCPKCARPWSGKHFVGERAITSTEAYNKGKRRIGQRLRVEEPEEDAGQDEDSEDGEAIEED